MIIFFKKKILSFIVNSEGKSEQEPQVETWRPDPKKKS